MGAPDPPGGGGGEDSRREMMTSTESSRGGADVWTKRFCLDKGEQKRTGTTELAAGEGTEGAHSPAPPAGGVAALWRVRLGGPLTQDPGGAWKAQTAGVACSPDHADCSLV